MKVAPFQRQKYCSTGAVQFATSTRTWLAAVCLSCLLLLFSGAVRALEPLSLRTDLPPTAGFNSIEYLEDPAQQMTIEQVRQLPAGSFTTVTLKNYNKGFSKSAFWLHLKLRNPNPVPIEWAVLHRMGFTDFVEYWVVVNDRVATYAIGGDRTLMAQRQTPYRFPAVRHTGQPEESADLYIRLRNTPSAAVLLLFDVSSGSEFIRMAAFDQLRLGLLYGMPLALAFMALIGWAFSRDRRFALYALYALAVLGSWLGINGQLGQYVFVDLPALANNAVQVFFMLAILFSSMFSRDFLHTRESAPWTDRYFLFLIWASVAGILLRFAGVYAPVTQLSMWLIILDVATPLVGWLAWRRGVVYARWYVFAQVLYNSMILVGILIGDMTGYSYGGFLFAEFGFFGQLLLLSVAQYDRMRLMQRDKKQAEQRHKEVLEAQVAERTRDLEEAREKADRASSSKSEFLANMSHEIRTPINAIAGFTTLAMRTDLDPKQSAYLEKIHSATQGLLRIINDLLDFSKIEAGHLDMERIPFRLSEVMDTAVAYVGPLAERKGLELLIHIAADVPVQCSGDPLRLGQVLVNLCSNAVKFTEHGEVAVSVALKSKAADHVRLLFTVRDTGIGLSPEQAGKLFQAFTQADTSTTRKFGGTGLGLTICQRLVGMMNGRIWLESKEAIGTSFFFEVELGLAQAPAPRDRLQLPPALREQPALVVDDNANSRQILTAELGELGMRPHAVESGEAALVELRQASRAGRPYPLVLMDWKMPGLNGVAATRAIRADPSIAGTPVIIMVTAYGREQVMSAPEDAALLDDILLKPVMPNLLLETLCRPRGAGESKSGKQTAAVRVGRLPGVRLLLVEDNPINQQLAQELLELEGAEVSVAGNGRLALALLQELGIDYFDAALVDLQMPEMDGYETARRVRALPAGAHLPLIAMTAHAMLEERERCLAAGMQDHAAKPIDMELLVLKLAHWIGAVNMARAASRPKKIGRPPARRPVAEAKISRVRPESTVPATDVGGPISEGLESLLARFSASLTEVNAGLASLVPHTLHTALATEEEAHPDDPALRDRLQILLGELRTCLQHNDTRAEKIVADMLALASGLEPRWLLKTAEAVNALDYDAALANLRDI